MILEAQILSNYINVTHSLTERLAFSSKYPGFFVDKFGRPLRFCYQEFDKEAIFDGFMAHPVFLGDGEREGEF